MLKKFLIALVLFILIFNISVCAQSEKVPILLYHNITDTYDIHQKLLHITPEAFKQHLVTLKNAGYNTITYNDFKEAVIGLKELPENPIIITFDDGYISNYQYAFPLLKELNMKATFFIVTGSVGNTKLTYPHFSWEQAKEMEKSGVIDIQSHSHTHRDFSTLTMEETLYEIRMSKYLIEKNLGKNVSVFAYPYGIDNMFSQDIIKNAGYSIINYVGNVGSNGIYEGLDKLKRITVAGDYSNEHLLELIRQNVVD